MQITFNNLYSRFIMGDINRREFEGMIFKIINYEQRRIISYGLKPEECNDFISWLYPRIHSSIDTYRETGSSFGAYIGTIIRLSAKEYRTRNVNNSITEYAAWTARVYEQYVHQEGPEYSEVKSNKTADVIQSVKEETAQDTPPGHPAPKPGVWEVPQNIKNPKQLLILILKCYCYVTDDFLDRIAPKVGVSKDKLKVMIDKLRSIRVQRDEEIRNMRERIYSQYYRCIVYEKKLSLMQENSMPALKMNERLEKARLRLMAMRKRMATIRCDASNSQVARVLGITKGAVDASLYNLKTKWSIDPNQFILN